MRDVESNRTNVCGIECVFAKAAKVREFFDSLELPLDLYYFHVVDESVFLDGVQEKIPKNFDPEYFRGMMRRSFWAEAFVAHLYPEGVFPEEIDTYQDFLQSGCEGIILICDCCYVEIYCKQEEWILHMLETARSIEGTIVEEKNEHTDARTEMYV